MTTDVKKEGKFSYIESGEGTPIIVLHGLMGGLSNFEGVISFFSGRYKVVVPELPLFSMPLLTTSVKTLAKYIHKFIKHKKFEKVILLGNSLGGHVGLLYTKLYPKEVKALILTGSSGLYESAMSEGYPRRGDYEFIKKKCEEVFYDPAVATKEIVDEVFENISDRSKLIKTLALAKSAIRHNMAKDLPKMTTPVCLIWGKNDSVTPPKVAEEFHELLPNSELFWIDKCGHAPMMEHPDEFNEVLNKWLERTDK
ncbi:Pimeloyl-ACP methyl ester carboxylesterase [Capnocytophaga haemolytica]|jgi:hydrolase, alpha/beta domain protein|uniref:Alpha/beta hydrolase n=1 Tax=Capnocytophaga haemolytica TaxID=45243 RepID=A0AAX2GX88_9FLAO|nr:alpha/beta hydrolase [Capnocytophaga haemolytica]AMD84654.1 alpha/beta hydrolase [Capnocytophaga haemolytica]SFO21623.1 Pimeloyl-ACP methyl ester carboxylesterase [Capnocytophaga haemolytica]SNV08652.1 Lipase 1 precursor [Capnocytophaga haemolytica]